MKDKELEELLYELLKKDESDSYIEFKENGDLNPSTNGEFFGQYISALSNSACLKHTDFGYLVLGIEDKTKKIVGTKFNIKTAKVKLENNKENLELHLNRNISPKINYEFYELEIDNKKVVILEIASAVGEPTIYKKKSYCRINESKTYLDSLPQKLIKKIYNSNTDWSYKLAEKNNKKYNFEDLDEDAVDKACRIIIKNNHHLEKFKNSPKTILTKAKILREDGEVVNATMLLLGKSEFFSDFGEIKIKFIGWKIGAGELGGAETFKIPFLLEVERVYAKIRPDIIKTFPDGSLFPNHDVINKYDMEACLEAINNCIAHNDYLQSKIIAIHQYQDEKMERIDVKVDFIDFESNGNFYDGNPQDYFDGKKTPKRYRNKFLAEAMKTLKMGVDVSGRGINFIYQKQLDKYFPAPDFISHCDDFYNETFKIRIYGKVIDQKFSEILINHPDFNILKIVFLDKIQKGFGEEVGINDANKLKEEKLIEGRRPQYLLSKKVAEILGKEAEYSEKKGSSNDEIAQTILKLLEASPDGRNRRDIDKECYHMISTLKNDKQKDKMIENILAKLKKNGLIEKKGEKRNAIWFAKIG
jgi:ATP-dependent DNA helicase RecG